MAILQHISGLKLFMIYSAMEVNKPMLSWTKCFKEYNSTNKIKCNLLITSYLYPIILHPFSKQFILFFIKNHTIKWIFFLILLKVFHKLPTTYTINMVLQLLSILQIMCLIKSHYSAMKTLKIGLIIKLW